MAPGRRRGAKGLKSTSELSLGDLVLAKVKGFPAWPAKISRPEEWEKNPDPKKYFVYFFGTSEIAFVAPVDIQAFTVEAKNKLCSRLKGKPLRFTQAVKEICEEFEELQHKKLNGSEDRDVLGSEDCSIDANEDDDAMEVDMEDNNSLIKPHKNTETRILDGHISPLERCTQRSGIIYGEERKPCSSGNVNGSVSPIIYSNHGTCKTDGAISLKKEVVSTSSCCSDYLSKEEGSRCLKAEADVTSVEEPNGACHTKEEGDITPFIQSTRGRHTDSKQTDPIKENKPRQLMGNKKKLKDSEKHHDSVPVIQATTAHDISGFILKPSSLGLPAGDGDQTGTPFDDRKKSSQGVPSFSEKKVKKFQKGKTDKILVNAETECKVLNKSALPKKKMNAHHGQLKQVTLKNEATHAVKRSSSVAFTDAATKTPTQTNKKVESNSSKDVKRSVWKGKMENHSTLGVSEFLAEDEDALHPVKRRRCAVEITGERIRKNIVAPKIESSSVDNVKSPFSESTKRRAVRLCDDEEEEAPKTPIHAGSAIKVSCSVDTAIKNEAIKESSTAAHVMKKRPRAEDRSAKELSSAERPVQDASPSYQKNVEKKLRKTGIKNDSPSPKRLVHEKVSIKDGKVAISSPKVSSASVATSRLVPGVEDGSTKELSSAERPVEDASPSSQKNVQKKLRKTEIKNDSPSPKRLVHEKVSIKDEKVAFSSPKVSSASVATSRPVLGVEKPSKENTAKQPDYDSQKKPPTSQGIVSGVGESSSTSISKQMGERSKHNLIKKATPKPSSHGRDAALTSGGVSGNDSVPGERLGVSRSDKTSYLDDLKLSDPDISMKHLIAAAQAKRRQSHLQNLNSNVGFAMTMHGEATRSSPIPVSPVPPLGFNSMLQPDALGLQAHSASPASDVRQLSTPIQHETEQSEEKKIESGNRVTESSLSGGTEAAVARDAFEGMIETLSRTKESIGRATRLAIDCAKYGIANEVVELLIRKLQSENRMHRKVDLFFLVDSITQCSHNHKGVAGASYIPTIQAALSRLLGAAAPPGAAARENRRQCLKVLKLWQERKILPEAFLRPFMDEIGVTNDEASSGLSLRRQSRVEQRAFDDPIREMEGMLVDEYGSNATFPLAGFFPSHAFDDNDDDDDDDEIMPTCSDKEVSERSPFEYTPVSEDVENQSETPNERRRCILEDVDGELEMEDVSVQLKDEMDDVSVPLKVQRDSFVCATTEVATSDIYLETPSTKSELPPLPEGSPPLPPNSPPQTPPLPSSPPPVLPQLPPTVPPPPPSPSHLNSFPLPYVGPPSGLLTQQPLQAQPSTAPQCLQPLPPSISSSPSVYQHQPSTNEIPVPSSGNQLTQIAATAPHDLPGRNDVYGQFLGFVPSEAVNPREPSRSNTSRPTEYSQIDAYGNPQPSQPSRQFQLPFTQTPLHPNSVPQNQPYHLAYQNASTQQLRPHPQHPYPQTFSLPNLPGASMVYVADDQWRGRPVEFNSDYQSNSWIAGGRSASGAPFAHEGFPRPLPERSPSSTFSFQPPRPSTFPAGASISGHVMSGQVDMHAHNRRPA